MTIYLIAIGRKMPDWVEQGFTEYSRRFQAECKLKLVEIDAIKRTKNADLERIKSQEGEKLLAAIPRGCKVIALDERGQKWTSAVLADNMGSWLQGGQDIAILIGGPEGLDSTCMDKAEIHWSLSPLTFPHPLVRVIVSEQLYRAWSILKNLPYHR